MPKVLMKVRVESSMDIGVRFVKPDENPFQNV